jgi:hypothetical protein
LIAGRRSDVPDPLTTRLGRIGGEMELQSATPGDRKQRSAALHKFLARPAKAVTGPQRRDAAPQRTLVLMTPRGRTRSRHALTCSVALRGPAEPYEGLLRGDPFAWLPEPVLEHGVHEFRCTVRPWWVGMVINCELSGPWVRGDVVARGVRLDARGTLIGVFVRDIRGDLTVAPATDGGTVLTFDGSWTSLRLRWGRGVAHRVVVAFLHEVAARFEGAVTDG